MFSTLCGVLASTDRKYRNDAYLKPENAKGPTPLPTVFKDPSLLIKNLGEYTVMSNEVGLVGNKGLDGFKTKNPEWIVISPRRGTSLDIGCKPFNKKER